MSSLKPLTLIFFFSSFSLAAFAQQPAVEGSYAWIEGIEYAEPVTISGIEADEQHNIYSVGFYTDSFNWLDTTFHHTGNSRNGLILKTDSARNPIWFQVIQSTDGASVDRVHYGKDGNLYVSGQFIGLTHFSYTGQDTLRTSSRQLTEFIASYTANGAFRWVKEFGAPGTNNSLQIRSNDQGELYIAGLFKDSLYIADLDTSFLAYPPVFPMSVKQLATVFGKLDTQGDWLWAKCLRPVRYQPSIAVDEHDNLWLGGSFFDSLQWGDTLVHAIGGQRGIQDAFLIKMNGADGAGKLFKHYQGNDLERIIGIHAGQNGLMYLSGTMYYDIKFGSLGFTQAMVTGWRTPSGFVASIDTSGQEIWFTPLVSCCLALSIIDGDKLNNIYVGGDFSEYIFLNDDTINIGNNVNSLLLKLDSSGDYQWHWHGKCNNFSRLRDFTIVDTTGGYVAGVGNNTLSLYADTLRAHDRMVAYAARFTGPDLTTGIQPLEQQQFSLYPNPASTGFRIELLTGNSPDKVSLLDINGRIIKTWKNTDDYALPELPTGMYVVVIQSRDRLEAKRLIIQR